MKDRRAKGLCGREGCAVMTGDDSYLCAVHAAKAREYNRALSSRKKAASVKPA